MSEATGRPPVIGISAYCEQAQWGSWDMPAVLIPRSYTDRVVAAGGVPVLLPPVSGVEAAIGRLDGLVLSGGPDVQPERYGAVPGPMTTAVRPERDAAELALFRAAGDSDLPVLAVCRGMQLMNVALGGSLVQHLPDVVGHDGHCEVTGQFGSHRVRLDPGSRLAAIVGTESATVATHHHQGIGELAAGLVPTAWADDGIIEAFERDDPAGDSRPFTVAVQWHPELGADLSLFTALVEAASTHITSRVENSDADYLM